MSKTLKKLANNWETLSYVSFFLVLLINLIFMVFYSKDNPASQTAGSTVYDLNEAAKYITTALGIL